MSVVFSGAATCNKCATFTCPSLYPGNEDIARYESLDIPVELRKGTVAGYYLTVRGGRGFYTGLMPQRFDAGSNIFYTHDREMLVSRATCRGWEVIDLTGEND